MPRTPSRRRRCRFPVFAASAVRKVPGLREARGPGVGGPPASSFPRRDLDPVTLSLAAACQTSAAQEEAGSAVRTLAPSQRGRPPAPARPLLSAVFGPAGSSPPSSQSAALPSPRAWPLSASGYSRSFSSIAPAPSAAGTHLAPWLAGSLFFLSPNKSDRPGLCRWPVYAVPEPGGHVP